MSSGYSVPVQQFVEEYAYMFRMLIASFPAYISNGRIIANDERYVSAYITIPWQ